MFNLKKKSSYDSQSKYHLQLMPKLIKKRQFKNCAKCSKVFKVNLEDKLKTDLKQKSFFTIFRNIENIKVKLRNEYKTRINK